jgi:hypothetical protein
MFKDLPSRILYLAKIFFRNKEDIKKFSDAGKLREFIINRPSLKQWLTHVLETKWK